VEEMRNSFKILIRKSEENRPLGRLIFLNENPVLGMLITSTSGPHLKKPSCIKMYLKEIEFLNSYSFE
jgi:hypothetical protein